MTEAKELIKALDNYIEARTEFTAFAHRVIRCGFWKQCASYPKKCVVCIRSPRKPDYFKEMV